MLQIMLQIVFFVIFKKNLKKKARSIRQTITESQYLKMLRIIKFCSVFYNNNKKYDIKRFFSYLSNHVKNKLLSNYYQ